jgi:hypothetical protein
MRKLVRGATRWFVVSSPDRVTVGPFVLGTSPIGMTPLGAAVPVEGATLGPFTLGSSPLGSHPINATLFV